MQLHRLPYGTMIGYMQVQAKKDNFYTSVVKMDREGFMVVCRAS